MILYICIYLLISVHSTTTTIGTTIAPKNPLVEEIIACEAIGPDLTECEEAEKCTFYDISSREVLTLKSVLQAFTPSGWSTGEVTAIHQAVGQDQITVDYPCLDGTSETCTVTDHRFSMRFRETNYTEIAGLRVTYPATKQREKLDRLDNDGGLTEADIHSRISQIGGEEWTDIWIYAAYGEVVNLQGPDLIITKSQDCLLHPSYIDVFAKEIQEAHNQVPEAVFCTKLTNSFDCELLTNCVWEETVCLANHWTNDLIICNNLKNNRTACEEIQSPNCKWLEPEDKEQYKEVDSYCVCCSAAQLNLMILFSLLFTILMC